MSDFNPIDLILKILALLVAIIGHEIMHGFVALKCGDSTAKLAGRLTINPIRHIDPLGSLIFPLVLFILNAPFLFGWAKPVPVDIGTVIENKGYKGAIFVSLAGIAYNLALAFIAALLLRTFLGGELHDFSAILGYFLVLCVIYNIVLAVFNLLPIPPLDGANALGYACLAFGSDTIPRFFNKIERFGIVILMAVLFFGAQFLVYPINALIRLFAGI